MKNTMSVACLALAISTIRIPDASAQVALEIKDFLTMPMTGLVDGKGSNDVLLSRVNTLREEAGGANRLFITDLNGPLYIVDKSKMSFAVYLDFKSIFRRLMLRVGLGNGLNGFYLDPDYTRNGKFYTVHMEDPALPASNLPDNKNFPGFNTAGYTVTPAIGTFGATQRESVVVEWTDSDISNSTFEGTAREVMRLQYNGRIHPMGDLIFNPTARPGD